MNPICDVPHCSSSILMSDALQSFSSESSCLVSRTHSLSQIAQGLQPQSALQFDSWVLFSMVPTCSACLISSFSALSTLRSVRQHHYPSSAIPGCAACSMSVTRLVAVCSKTSSLWNPNLPKHCHVGDGKCEQGELLMLLKLVPRRDTPSLLRSALFVVQSQHVTLPGKAQQYTPGSKP